MPTQRLPRPRLATVEAIVRVVVTHEVHGQLAAHDELLQKCGDRRRLGAGIANRQRDLAWSDVTEVQVRRQAAGAVDLGMIARRVVGVEQIADEPPELSPRFTRSAADRIDCADAAIDRQVVDQTDAGCRRRHGPRGLPDNVGLRILGRNQPLIELTMEARPDRARGVLLGVDERRGHDDIGVDRPERHTHVRGNRVAPAFGLPQRVLVADEERWPDVIEKREQPVLRIRAEHEPHAPPRETIGDVREPVGEKPVVTKIAAGHERIDPEEDHHGFAKAIARVDRDVERRVVPRALRPLHPVDDGGAIGIGRTVDADVDAGRGHGGRDVQARSWKTEARSSDKFDVRTSKLELIRPGPTQGSAPTYRFSTTRGTNRRRAGRSSAARAPALRRSPTGRRRQARACRAGSRRTPSRPRLRPVLPRDDR